MRQSNCPQSSLKQQLCTCKQQPVTQLLPHLLDLAFTYMSLSTRASCSDLGSRYRLKLTGEKAAIGFRWENIGFPESKIIEQYLDPALPHEWRIAIPASLMRVEYWSSVGH